MAGALQLIRRPFVIGPAVVAALTGALTAGGCRQSPPPPPKSASVEAEPLAKAREAMDRRDYGTALGLLREAVGRRPGELEVHYRLGVTASHLDQVDEASREFSWVVAHGDGGATEVQIAREWLAARTPAKGPLPGPAVLSPARDPAPNPDRAVLAGRAIDADGPRRRLQLFLKGVPGTDVKDERHMLRTDQEGNFRFTDVVPGDYVLTNTIAGPPTWRLRVSLARGQRLALDLTPANQATVRDDFPESR